MHASWIVNIRQGGTRGTLGESHPKTLRGWRLPDTFPSPVFYFMHSIKRWDSEILGSEIISTMQPSLYCSSQNEFLSVTANLHILKYCPSVVWENKVSALLSPSSLGTQTAWRISTDQTDIRSRQQRDEGSSLDSTACTILHVYTQRNKQHEKQPPKLILHCKNHHRWQKHTLSSHGTPQTTVLGLKRKEGEGALNDWPVHQSAPVLTLQEHKAPSVLGVRGQLWPWKKYTFPASVRPLYLKPPCPLIHSGTQNVAPGWEVQRWICSWEG